jgi:two-component system, chemotaxis family, sensor kinase CheA
VASNEQLAALFREEASDHLAALETTLLELEQRPRDPDLVAQAFRALHSIKGSGAMAGFDRIAAIAHELESIFVQIRQGNLSVSPEIIALTLESKDVIRAMLEPTGEVSKESQHRLHVGFQVILDRIAGGGTVENPQAHSPAEPVSEPASEYRIDWSLHRDFFQNGSNPLGILAELKDLGSCSTSIDLDALPRLEDLDPEDCHLRLAIQLRTDKSENEIRDVFIFVEDRCDLRISPGPADLARRDDPSLRMTSTMSSLPTVGARRVASPTSVRPDAREGGGIARTPENASSIRVTAQKLDSLVDLVGELVIAQARLEQLASSRGDDQLSSIAEDIGRLSSELRNNTLDIRMVPIGTTFVRFKRLVHDLSSELGKDIHLQTDGAETELDKTVIERLFDPLVHLIRNSCDHGIESPETRRQAGKDPVGTVHLLAYHSGQNVFVEIRDDGAGLDPAAIRKKAVSSGLLEEGAQVSVEQLHKMIFLPGFSTARSVSNVSGRGVGMDVVKRSVEALRGQIDIRSEPGKGTTIRLQLPLTLAIIEGLLVAVGDDRYVLPMAIVEECVELTTLDIEQSHDNRLANVRGELVPYIRLRDWFGSPGMRPAIEQIAIATVEAKRYGFVVDGVVGQRQTVIKSLGRMYQNVRGLSGATILGDGTLALIVDVPALLRSVQQAA